MRPTKACLRCNVLGVRLGRLVVPLALMMGSVACSQSFSSTLAELRSAEDTTRVRAFYELLDLANAGQTATDDFRASTERWAKFARQRPEVAIASIHLLERENRKVFREGGSDSEDYSNYYANLIGHVAALKDTLAVEALAGAMTTGAMATDGLVALGKAALPAVERATTSQDILTRGAALHTLGEMASTRQSALGDESRARVKARLVAGLTDQWPGNRIAAIDALSAFRDRDVRAIIERIAATDTSRFGSGATLRYPVRAAARAWLAQADFQ